MDCNLLTPFYFIIFNKELRWPVLDVIFPTQSSTYLGKNVLKQNLCFPVDPVGGVNVTSAVQLPITLLLSSEVITYNI
jgi:hypothetical protein